MKEMIISLTGITLFSLENKNSKTGVLILGDSRGQIEKLSLVISETHNVFSLIKPTLKQVTDALDEMDHRCSIIGGIAIGNNCKILIRGLIQINYLTVPVVLMRDSVYSLAEEYKGNFLSMRESFYSTMGKSDMHEIATFLKSN